MHCPLARANHFRFRKLAASLAHTADQLLTAKRPENSGKMVEWQTLMLPFAMEKLPASNLRSRGTSKGRVASLGFVVSSSHIFPLCLSEEVPERVHSGRVLGAGSL